MSYAVTISGVDDEVDEASIAAILKQQLPDFEVTAGFGSVIIFKILRFQEAQRLHDLLKAQLPQYQLTYELMAEYEEDQ